MQQQNSGISCALWSWALAAGVGLLVVILLLVVGGWGVIGSIFMGGLAFVVLGLAFSWIFCRSLPEARGPGNIDTSGVANTSAPAPKASAPKAASPNAPPPSVPPAPTADEATSPAKAAPVGVAAPAAAAAATEAKPAEKAKTEAPATAAKPAADSGPAVKPSARLAGQEDLASRKGEWKYEGGSGTSAKAAPAAATPDYDGDGKNEGAEEGSKPATLAEAREGGPDNLKEIKGVGPKLEKLLHSMGFYHFDQIANWTADEVAWVNANLVGFKGRVSRDNWVEQAKILASGGETEFSKRVDKGDVY